MVSEDFKSQLQKEIDELLAYNNEEFIPVPKVEVAPKSVLIHFPVHSKQGMVWQGMQLTPDEASAFGFKLLEASELAFEKDTDA
jgi:hypothetical protein